MRASPPGRWILVGLVTASACGAPGGPSSRLARIDREAQAAFVRGSGPARGGRSARQAQPLSPASPGVGPRLEGWPRVLAVLRAAPEVFEGGDRSRELGLFVTKWCEVEPSPLPSPEGVVYVCLPKPPIEPDGWPMTLELGSAGTIGLVARDLADAPSQALVRKAIAETEPLCATAFTSAPAPALLPHQEFRTCALRQGGILTVGRFPRDLAADLWQVSLAVLDAS